MYTLFHRPYSLTSGWSEFHKEITLLQQYFIENYYPAKVFFKHLNKFLNNKLIGKNNRPTAPRMPFFASVPFINDTTFYTKVKRIIREHCPALHCQLIPTNPLTIGSLFRYKDKLSPLLTSNVVYLFTCPRCSLGNYVGASRRLLKVRIDSHRGVSYRTGVQLSSPDFSSIREHAKKCKLNIEYKHFEILARASSPQQLAVFESLFIKTVVPKLNNQTTATPLYLA